ncbi:FG-GAP-like repeat-containing protein [Tautonia plasticadhaerens]|uniref:FG-GAP repeat protein n=1 Tax=Tautonia plasticadhaerens TaxID=2527974 RepID=A0A518H777_9BACT|nr:FG-GAP-like repeat-containing protein [Tautonia plasticadhaerens]QDV36606.1 FG-GAP repeat protein [Tautonia plasticadhaerens]
MRRRVWLVVLLGSVAALVALSARSRLARRADRIELATARAEVARGAYDRAARRIHRLRIRGESAGEARFLLGRCEEALGRPGRAIEAWEGVPDGSPFDDEADLHRARLLADALGRFAEAEAILGTFPRPGTSDAARERARDLHSRLLRFQGRFGEIRELIRTGWARSPRPSEDLVRHWRLESDPFPSEAIRAVLDEASLEAPGDDRVRLGRAILALREGELAEADRLLGDCLRSSPDDPAVRRAQLDLARAAGDPAGVRSALEALPAHAEDEAWILELRAWLADRLGDDDASRSALDRLLALEPGHPWALERRIERALRDEDGPGASALRARKAEADRARERYRALLSDGADPNEYDALAREAEALGRRFEAEGWTVLALRGDPFLLGARERLERLRARVGPSEGFPPGARLADLVLDGLPAAPGAGEGEGGRAGSPSRSPAPEFSDEAGAAGLAFTFDNGASAARQLPETMAGGVGLLDADGDGRLDVYAIQGGRFPPADHPATSADRLFRNRGDGTFEDATAWAGIDRLPGGYGHGVAVGDVDDDGDPDLFLTRWDSYALLRNRGDGTFEDATEAFGLGGPRGWPTSAAFADLDGDGDLDLYVCHYLQWDPRDPRRCVVEGSGGEPGYCDPRLFPAEPDRLFRNDGGRFVDVTEEAGIVDPDGRGLGVVAADLDGDRLVDLYVANDTTANSLYRNLGGLRFEEVGQASGVAAAADGGYQAGMGVDCGDGDGDGLPDLVVTNFFGEGTTFYRNLGGGQFVDASAGAGLTVATRSRLGFGVAWLDADGDGLLDLAQANGHVNRYPSLPFEMPAQLLIRSDRGRWITPPNGPGSPWEVPRLGRGLARGDLDGDGRPDLVLVGLDGPMAWLRNRSGPGDGHRLVLQLEGTESNRDAVGAVVSVEAGGRNRVGYRIGGGSYQSANAPQLYFGLGENSRAEVVEVSWPSGRIDRFRDLPADAGYRLVEGAPEARPLSITPEAMPGSGPR